MNPALLVDDPRTPAFADMLKALAHPLRLRIASLVAERPHYVNEMVARLGQPQSIVSQQLRILRMSGLVEFSRTGGRSMYRAARPGLGNLLQCLGNCTKAD